MKPRDVVNGRFEIDRRAGAGGMGTVYRAIDRQTGAPVAVKVIFGNAPDLAERFGREAAVLAELQHPGIVRFVATGATPDGEAFLAMEWLEGEGLDERLARGKLSVPETVELGRAVASALAAAHARGIVHRDLKPSNLFLVGKDLARATILDFGIARIAEPGSLTRTGQTLGSPGYTSPEQARGERGLDARADVFSLACVLFKCLTGDPPFTGSVLEVLLKVVTDPAPLASSVRPDVPPALEHLLQRMLAKKAEGRPADAAAVGAELAAVASAFVPPTNRHPVPLAERTADWSEAVKPVPRRPDSVPPGSVASPRSVASPSGPGAGAWRTAPLPVAPHDGGGPAPAQILGPASVLAPPPPTPARRRSRALLFLLAALGILVLAAGVVAVVLVVQTWMDPDEPTPPLPAKPAPPAPPAQPARPKPR